jgi:uncharacterized membrane protein required for colicin V production
MISVILGAVFGFVSGILVAKAINPHSIDLPNLLGWAFAAAAAYLGSNLQRLLANRTT